MLTRAAAAVFLMLASAAQANEVFNVVADVDELTRLDPGPPPHEAAARMARYVVHRSDWAAMATISARQPMVGSPFANVFSVSDGKNVKEASGVPYLFLTPLEMSVKDLHVDSRASLTMSLAQGAYCDSKKLDPEDPRCAHIILTGKIVPVGSTNGHDSVILIKLSLVVLQFHRAALRQGGFVLSTSSHEGLALWYALKTI